MRIPIARPFFGDEEKREVLAVLDSGQLVQGAWVERLEQAFAELVGARYAVATSSGTTALTAALLAHGVGPGDEVIVPSFSFFATASSVLSVQARPVFVDVDSETFTLSVEAACAAITPRTRAILPVHLFGHPANLPALTELCERHGLLLLEDAAQAHLAAIDGNPIGRTGTAVFSLHGSKNATSGEGGLVLTNDARVYERLRGLRNHGRLASDRHEMLGFNFRMTNLCAAVGIPQLSRLEGWTARRIDNAAFYAREIHGAVLPLVRPGHRHVFHQFTVRTPPGRSRDAVVLALRELGVDARVYYPLPIHRQPIMIDLGLSLADLAVTDELCRTVFSLPVHPQLSTEDLAFVADAVSRLC